MVVLCPVEEPWRRLAQLPEDEASGVLLGKLIVVSNPLDDVSSFRPGLRSVRVVPLDPHTEDGLLHEQERVFLVNPSSQVGVLNAPAISQPLGSGHQSSDVAHFARLPCSRAATWICSS